MTQDLLSPDLLRLSQLDTVDFIKSTPYCAVFCDLGFGKTVTSLTSARDLLDSGEIKKVLVVAPLRVARDTWPDEIKEWEHTTHISFKFIEGNPKQRRKAAKGREKIHVINQENFVWLVTKAGRTWPYDMVIFDDTKGFKTSKIKNKASKTICEDSKECPLFETERSGHCQKAGECGAYVPEKYSDACLVRCTDFKQVRDSSKSCANACRHFKPLPARYTRYGALLAIRPQIKRLVHLTGTPSSKELLDLWPLIHTIDMGKRLGRTYSAYKRKYFTPSDSGFSFYLRPGAEEAIHKAIGDICIAIECEEELTPCHSIEEEITLPPEAAKMYDEFERDFAIQLEEKDEEVFAQNSGVLAGKLLQVCGGAVYYGEAEEKTWAEIHDEKFKRLDKILETHKGEPVLVGYNFGHELQRLKERYPHGVDIRDRRDAVKAWNAGKIPLMFAHPDSAGHGLNLQKGPGRTLVWLGLNWSLDLNHQLNKRLHRPGQLRDVYIYYLIAKGRADTRVRQTLARKDATQRELLQAVRRDARKKVA
jgi:hypothetical protein